MPEAVELHVMLDPAVQAANGAGFHLDRVADGGLVFGAGCHVAEEALALEVVGASRVVRGD